MHSAFCTVHVRGLGHDMCCCALKYGSASFQNTLYIVSIFVFLLQYCISPMTSLFNFGFQFDETSYYSLVCFYVKLILNETLRNINLENPYSCMLLKKNWKSFSNKQQKWRPRSKCTSKIPYRTQFNSNIRINCQFNVKQTILNQNPRRSHHCSMAEVTETRHGLPNKFQNIYWKYMMIVCFRWSIRFPCINSPKYDLGEYFRSNYGFHDHIICIHDSETIFETNWYHIYYNLFE